MSIWDRAPELTLGYAAAAAWYALQSSDAGLALGGSLAAGAGAGVIVTAASLVAVRGALRTWALLRGESAAPVIEHYDLPEWPESPGISLVLGEDHGSLDGSFCSNPSWYSIPAKGLYTGIAIIGATGGSKTAGVIRPALSQLLAYGAGTLDRAPAALIQDFKASLVPVAIDVATECGRLNDLVIIGPDRPYRWNPIHDPGSEPRVLAGRLMSALENLSGGAAGSDTKWVSDGASRCAESAIGMLRAAHSYVTLKDVHEFVASVVAACSADDSEGGGDELGRVLTVLDDAFMSRALDEAEIAQYAYYRAYWTTEFKPQADKFRAIYASELGRLTQYFADPRYAHLYSPAEADIDLPSWDEAIERGLIVVLDATTSLFGPLGTALGVFLKLAMQRSSLSRPARCRDNPALNNTRAIVYCVDEFQEFCSDGGSDGGDSSYFALSRESKGINIVAFQSRSSLIPKLGEDRTRRLLASLRTKIFLALADDQDYEYAANLISKHYKSIASASVQEHVTDAEQSAGQFVGAETSVSESRSIRDELRHDVEPATFRELPAFTGIVSGFDGNAAMPPALVRLKAYWRPREETYAEFLPIFLEQSRA